TSNWATLPTQHPISTQHARASWKTCAPPASSISTNSSPTTMSSSTRPTSISPSVHATPSLTTHPCWRCAACTPSDATAAGPIAPSKTISSKPAPWPNASTPCPEHKLHTQKSLQLCRLFSFLDTHFWLAYSPVVLP